jgi:putative SOS response-associated peptidase YedK
MPVILDSTDFDLWLDPGVHEPEVIRPWLRPYPMAALSMHPVGRLVNRLRNDGPECVAPLAGEAA